jgi:tetratricopeptide (TPR) repeat protein
MRRFPDETIAAVVQRGGGVPLFLEEVARLLLESGDGGQGHQIPPTLHASLLARLDRLGPVKEIAQIGSVIGREFDWPLIRAVAGIDEDRLTAGLDRLAEADMIHAKGRPPEASYRFDQAMFQDAAYDSLLKSRRRELHETVARTLAEAFPDLARGRPELLAHHLTEAGSTEAAIDAWQRAGEAAMARGAFVEAAGHLDHGIRLIKTLPTAQALAPVEFRLRSMLAQSYWASKGFGAPETRAAFEAALALGESLGDTRTLSTVLSGLVAALTQQAQFDEAQVLADRLSTLAQWPGSGAFERGWAALRQGAIRFYAGDIPRARALFDDVLRYGSDRADTAIGGVSLGGMAGIYRPWLAATSADAVHALAYADEGLRWADQTGSPHDRAFALTGAVIAGLQLGNTAGTGERLRELLTVTEEHRLRVLRASAVLFDAWATLLNGDAENAVVQFFHGLLDYTSIGQKVLLNWFTALQAQAIAATGDFDQALAAAEQAVAHVRCSPLYRPEVLRIKADILAGKARSLTGPAAEALLREARTLRSVAEGKAKELGIRLSGPIAATPIA